eukprot:Sspe_Gene.49346::Locus_26492_Transcript_2_2_Confidence_0.750_Length_987::g.49346::m.49346/K08857/NEK1_4_5; NIMA (never in mitosis gene a)-related kinase 1/4/5
MLEGIRPAESLGENRRYRKVRLIGKGSFGRVYLCQGEDGSHVVAKRLEVGSEPSRPRKVLRELDVMRRLRHDNIVSLLDAWQSTNAVYIVMEYAPCGDLEQCKKGYIKHHRVFSQDRIVAIATQVARCLDYLHSNSIIHRDLKSANVFLCFGGVVKVGDFGLSRVLAHSDALARTSVGTPYYMSPELCKRELYSSKSDVWAFGVLLYECMYFSYPFDVCTGQLSDLYRVICAGIVRVDDCDDLYTPLLKDVVMACLQVDPALRPTASEVVEVLTPKPVPMICDPPPLVRR